MCVYTLFYLNRLLSILVIFSQVLCTTFVPVNQGISHICIVELILFWQSIDNMGDASRLYAGNVHIALLALYRWRQLVVTPVSYTNESVQPLYLHWWIFLEFHNERNLKNLSTSLGSCILRRAEHTALFGYTGKDTCILTTNMSYELIS